MVQTGEPLSVASAGPRPQANPSEDQRRSEDTPAADLQVMQEQLRSLKERNDILDGLVAKYRRIYGSDLS